MVQAKLTLGISPSTNIEDLTEEHLQKTFTAKIELVNQF
jgi:hypothetical protein